MRDSITIRIIISFVATLLLMILLLVLASAIPNHYLLDHQTGALSILEKEGTYPQYFFNTKAARQDNFTDVYIMKQAINDENDSAIEAAMHRSYPRYWHGYSIFIRPLLVCFTLYQIRYILMLCCFFLFGLATILIARSINIVTALAFDIAVSMSYFIVVATSLQFMPVYIISFCAIIYELAFFQFVKKYYIIYFLIIGMITSFIDFLTAPIITLGLPLIIYLLMDKKLYSFGAGSKVAIGSSVIWAFGYGATWSSKWVIGTIILGENLFSDAAERISFRTMGDDEYAGNLLSDRIEAIRINAETMFISEGRRVAIVFLVLLLIVLLLLAIRNNKQMKKSNLAILFVGLYPYIWYFVLSNHSIIHFWFTYRAQVITIFAVAVLLIQQVDWKPLLGRKRLTDN